MFDQMLGHYGNKATIINLIRWKSVCAKLKLIIYLAFNAACVLNNGQHDPVATPSQIKIIS